MAHLNETVSFQGKSGNSYAFKAYAIDEECPSESGIYIFSKRTIEAGRSYYRPIYIGKAQSFEKRLYNHHKDDCIDKNGANSICLLQVGTDAERTRIENDLLGRWNTSCNEVNN